VKPAVYVETSVIGHLTSWPQSDVTVLGHQVTTRKWWETAPARFDLFVSESVVREAGAGDPHAARERLEALAGLTVLPTTPEVERLVQQLILGHAVPEVAPEDALHIALAAVHGVEYLVTWNCRHIANAAVRATIERVCRSAGYEPPVICTPEELLEG
jgi:predicted nucleic acid-binding protein